MLWRAARPCRATRCRPACSTENFAATASNQVWLADLTYIRTGEGWLFLAALNQAQALYSAGIISPLIPPGGPGSVRKVVFGRSHLNGFLSRIEAMEVVPAEFRGEIVSISVACQREGGTTPDLVQAIWDRRIMAWRDPLHTGLRSILVRLCDVRVLRERAGRALA